jgi:zinc and cadmium transporter
MSAYAWVAVYSVAVLFFSLAGGAVPLLKRVSHDRLQLYLSLSAGVMLGAACFHVLPDAVEALPESFGWWVAGGVVGLFVIERFIAPHSHEPGGPKQTAGEKDHGDHHDHEHHHDHDHGHAHEHHALAAPPVAGWAAVLGLTLHTFMNGVAMAGAIEIDVSKPSTWWLPGLAVFLAIVLHKPADALAISTVLRRRGVKAGAIGLVQLGFASMVPIGALTFLVTHNALSEGLAQQITGAALAFSAGTFLFIALSDLLPEIHFHRHDRVPLFLALLTGVVFMGIIALFEPHEEHKGGQENAPTKPADGPG